MRTFLFWVYLLNSVLLILHEMDSAFWREWEMFHLPGKIGFFLAIHVPILAVLMLGLVFLALGASAGLWISLAGAAGGLAAFGIHSAFLKKGRPEFATKPSRVILCALLAGSVLQAGLTLRDLFR